MRTESLHDDDERWLDNVAIVRKAWDQNGRWLGVEHVIRRHWRGRDALPQYGWKASPATSVAFETREEAGEWVDAAWNALHLARAQRLTADQMLEIAQAPRDQQVGRFSHLFTR